MTNASIGNFCSISWNVSIGPMEHPARFLSTHEFVFNPRHELADRTLFDPRSKSVQIGNDVWIGCNCVIMPGIKVGDGAIIGSGAVVTKDVPPYAVVTGVPASVLRYRFDDEIIEDLLELKWWELPDDFIRQNTDLFSVEFTAEAVSALRERRRSFVGPI